MYMNTPVNRALLILAAHCLFQLGFANASEAVADGTFVRSFLDTHCIRCHGEKKSKGDVTLHKLSTASKAATDLSVWKKVFEQLESGEMPPEESKQPTTAGRQQAMISIKNTLKAGGGSVDEFRVLASAHGNWVDHDALFSGKAFGESGTLGRVWRLTPGGYLSIIIRLNKELNLGLNDVRSSNGLSIRAPWALARKWDFQDYSAALRLTEPELDHHLNNCVRIAEGMVPQIAKGGSGSPLKKVQALLSAGKAATSEQVEAAVIEMFDYVLHLQLEPEELRKYSQALTADLQSREATKAVTRFAVQVLHHSEMLFREEMPLGTATRSIMSPHQLARSIAFGLTDCEPDPALWQAAAEGGLTSGAGVQGQVERILNDPQIPKPRILRFFQEYFGYHLAEDVSKEKVTLDRKLGQKNIEVPTQFPGENLVYDTDRLVEWVLASDKQVLRTLLTTQKTFVLARFSDDLNRAEARIEVQKRKDAERAAKENKPFDPDAKAYKVRRELPGDAWPSWLQIYGFVAKDVTWHPLVYKGIAPPPSGVALEPEQWYKSEPVDFPPGQRMGILTQPSWLVAMSSNFDNHAIHRGRWIRERMLGGRVPEVPITVNAMLPEEPHNGLRERMRVTREEYCWKCHKSMDPLGLVFEQYDHVGRYREKEIVVDKEKTEAEKKRNPGALDIMKLVPFDTTGAITDSGDPKLDGPVNGPFEFIKKLVESERVEQVFVRHVFRYFLGRNETLADGPVLVAAHKAYRDSNGSFKALLVSLLTSDAFLYRTAPVLAKNFP